MVVETYVSDTKLQRGLNFMVKDILIIPVGVKAAMYG
tara:strand:+ start:34 stop:144 length:111 start_codon:yes stop_codon:yes gene_type:complete